MAEIDDLVANYTELAATTGESHDSIATRVEAMGSQAVAAAIRAAAPAAAPDAAPVGRAAPAPAETA